MQRFLKIICAVLFVSLFSLTTATAQNAAQTQSQGQAQNQGEAFRSVLIENQKLIQRSSAKTVEPVLQAIGATGFDGVAQFLTTWQNRDLWFRRDDGVFFYVTSEDEGETFTLIDVVTGEAVGTAGKRELRQIKPNSGVRRIIGANLVQFQLIDPDVDVRRTSLESIARDPSAEHLGAIRTALETEANPDLLTQMTRLERLLTMEFDPDTTARVAAIQSFADSLAIDVRAKLNRTLRSQVRVGTSLPLDQNIARVIQPDVTTLEADGTAGSLSYVPFMNDAPELTFDQAYDMLVTAELAPPIVTADQRKEFLIANIQDGMVATHPVADLNTNAARDEAYQELVLLGVAEPFLTVAEKQDLVAAHVFYGIYDEPDALITAAAAETLNTINSSVFINEFIDLALDGISLASIYFLAAIGLAITFGVMRVINMAHGEFIMMGAYSGYVVQLFITNYTLSIIVAIPVAFAVTFAVGVAMERLIIRHLYHRPLETLLATFGVSIALQQLAKNIFGTQARPLTAPEWLDGALIINDVVSISWIRIAIFILSALFFLAILFVLNRTRLGLETRAVTQNPRMAASMGIDPDKINMLTFGLGCGIAGIAGVAIGLFAKVTSELGNDYIVQSFMTVVVGGVGNIWGTLAGATMIGFLQKFIEYFNPSNTLAAQTFMIIFIIIFIQFRPRGLIAMKGRAAES